MLKQNEQVLKAFLYVKAYMFFPRYCPEIRNYKNKMAGRSGRGNPLEFTEDDLNRIRQGLELMAKDNNLAVYRGRLPGTRKHSAERLNKFLV
jgi:hypothetical protein